MTGLERVFASVTGDKKDYLAISLTLSLYGARLTGCSLPEYYNSSLKYYEGMKAVKERFNPDILFTPFALAAEGEAFGSKAKYLPFYAPNIAKPATLSPKELLETPLPSAASNERIKYLYESARLMAKNLGKENAIAGILLSPVDLPALIMGLDGWLDTIIFHEEEARKICEKLTGYFVDRANALFNEGIHIIALPVIFSNPAIITKGIIDSFVLPYFSKAFSMVKGPLVIHHGVMQFNNYLNKLKDLPNVAAFAIDAKDKLKETREIIGKEKVLLGNIDGPSLNRYSVPHVEQICRRILDEREGDNHFIFASSAADIPYDTPPENIDALLKAVRRS